MRLLLTILVALQAAPGPEDRIESALHHVREGDAHEVDRAIRDLALLGDVALPAILERYPHARSGERIHLLLATSRLDAAAPLREQALEDPDPAVRTWAAGPVRRDPPLSRLAARYLDVLALAETDKRREADSDLEAYGAGGSEDPAWRRLGARPIDDVTHLRRSTLDRSFGDAVQRLRSGAAAELAARGAAALRSGELQPRLDDPVFVVYLTLLREKSPANALAFSFATTALVELGRAAEPALEALLDNPRHDPRVVLPILYAVRADGGTAFFDRLSEHRPEVQRALLRSLPRALDPARAARVASAGARASDDETRRIALDLLESMQPPAGVEEARAILESPAPTYADVSRAMRLLVRAGELEPVIAHAEAEAGAEDDARRVRDLRSQAIQALHAVKGGAARELGRRYLSAESPALRSLGIALTEDADALFAFAAEADDGLMKMAALRRALDVGGDEAAERIADLVPSMPSHDRSSLLHALDSAGATRQLAALAVEGEGELREAALHRLAGATTLDSSLAEPLLALHDAQPGAATLAALLPLGGEGVRRRVIEAGPAGLEALAGRANSGEPLPFSVPLLPWISEVDAFGLKHLTAIASAASHHEPSVFAALLDRWDALSAEAGDEAVTEARRRLLGALARSADAASAEILFARLLSGGQKRPPLRLGTLKAAARLVPPERLRDLIPLLRASAAAERPIADRESPPYDELRLRLVWGGMHALAWAGVGEALPFLCDVVLDPELQPSAFDWRGGSPLPWWALDSLRHFSAASVRDAFTGAVARAESSGRLAALHHAHLRSLARHCRAGREWGRKLDEVALALADVLARLPRQDDAHFERMLALGGLRRYAEAAAAARDHASLLAELDVRSWEAPLDRDRILGRAVLYDAVAAGDRAALLATRDVLSGDPYLLYLYTWYDLFLMGASDDETLSAAREAVRATAGLDHAYRDTLAAVHLARGEPEPALEMLDLHRELPVDRRADSGWHLLHEARAHAMRGERTPAERALESALSEDRRLFPYLDNFPELSGMDAVVSRARDELFDTLFRWEE